jgi:hypothetical protein
MYTMAARDNVSDSRESSCAFTLNQAIAEERTTSKPIRRKLPGHA